MRGSLEGLGLREGFGEVEGALVRFLGLGEGVGLLVPLLSPPPTLINGTMQEVSLSPNEIVGLGVLGALVGPAVGGVVGPLVALGLFL